MGVKRDRDERKQRAAAQREAQRQRDRRQRRIVFGVSVPIAALIIAAVPVTNWYNAHQRGIQHSVGYVRAASKTAKAAGCTGVRNDRQMETKLVDPGATVDYAALTAAAEQAVPPTSGPREVNPLPATPAFFAVKDAPAPERVVGNLNHGFVVVWYDSTLPAAQVTLLQTAATANGRTLVVPWTRSALPDGKHVVLTAWDRTQRCTEVSPQAIAEFAAAYRDDTTGKGWASPSAPTPSGSAGTAPTPSASATPGTSATPVPSTTAAPSVTPSAAPEPSATAIPTTTYAPNPNPTASGSPITVSPVR